MDPIDKDVVQRQFQELQEIDARRNIIPRSQFKTYEPLYRHPKKGDPPRDYVKLAREFISQIDPYRPITIVDDSDHSKVVLELPHLFSPTSNLSGQKAAVLSAIVSKGSPGDFNRSSLQAQKEYLDMLATEGWDLDQVIQSQTLYQEKLKAFNKTYGKGDPDASIDLEWGDEFL